MHPKFLPFIALTAVLTLVSACSSDSSDDDTFAAGTPCGFVETIAPAAIVSGALAQTDCTADQTFPDQSSGDFSFVDEYQVTLTTPGTLTVSMRSTTLDAYLLLLSSSATCRDGCDFSIVMATDNNSAGGTDALISMDLAAGTYGIHANSIAPGSGSYTLETTFTP